VVELQLWVALEEGLFTRRRSILFFSAGGAFAVASFIACAAIPCAAAQSNEHNLNGAEQWACYKISQGQPADFNANPNCGDLFDPKRDDSGIASQKCRILNASFFKDILKQLSSDNGVDVRGAKIIGDVDLSFATLNHPLRITNSRFEGGICLADAHAERFVDLSGSSVSGDIALEGAPSSVTSISMILRLKRP
jgi:hypothetical protein